MIEPEYLEGAFYVLCECRVCRLIFQQDIPNDALMKRLYEKWIDPRAIRRLRREESLAYYSRWCQEIMQVIAFLTDKPASLRVLDFGMGWGEWTLMAKAFGCESFGTELSAERLEHARSNGIGIVTWDEIPDHQFDLINAEKVFEHIPEPLLTLHHLKRALKPGGLLKICVPTALDMRRRLRIMDWTAPKGARNSLNPVAPLEHINFYRRSSLDRMAHEAGMEEVCLPMTRQYRYATDWGGTDRILANLFAPVIRNLIRVQNRVFLRNRG